MRRRRAALHQSLTQTELGHLLRERPPPADVGDVARPLTPTLSASGSGHSAVRKTAGSWLHARTGSRETDKVPDLTVNVETIS